MSLLAGPPLTEEPHMWAGRGWRGRRGLRDSPIRYGTLLTSYEHEHEHEHKHRHRHKRDGYGKGVAVRTVAQTTISARRGHTQTGREADPRLRCCEVNDWQAKNATQHNTIKYFAHPASRPKLPTSGLLPSLPELDLIPPLPALPPQLQPQPLL